MITAAWSTARIMHSNPSDMSEESNFFRFDDDEVTDPRIECMSIARVLVADDDEALRLVVVSRLLDDGYAVFEAESGGDILRQLEVMRRDDLANDGLDLLLLDNRMPGISGLELLRKLRASQCRIPVILMTAFPDPALREVARSLGAPVLSKPFSLAQLSDVAQTMLLGRGAS